MRIGIETDSPTQFTGHARAAGNHSSNEPDGVKASMASPTLPPSTTPLPDPDADLVRRCQAGGPDAEACFAELMDRHAGRIRSRATRILGSESDAEDVLQDVFVNVHRFLHRYQPDRPFQHWLSVVTLNACRIELRRRAGIDRRHSAYRIDPTRPTETRQSGDPILRRWLEEALETLPPLTRRAIVLRAIDGLGYREIAERCGLSEPATKMRVLRGLRDLRAAFDADENRPVIRIVEAESAA